MPTTTIVTPYATAMEFVKDRLNTSIAGEYDAQRVASYDLYDDLYSSSPSTYSLMLRGSDDRPIYVPTAKRMINALSRFVGKGWGYSARPVASDVSAEQGTDATGAAGVDSVAYSAALEAMGTLFRRENLLSVFSSSKKAFLRRGDWCWYVSADPTKDQGKRISVKIVDPRSYYPLLRDSTDPYRVTAQQIIEETLFNDTLAYDIQTWYRQGDTAYQGDGANIQYEHVIWDQKDYSDPAKRVILSVETPLETVEGITNLPIYHIRNNEDPENPFGTSDLAGLESVVAAINQAVSDEDMALALTGLGMYWTDGGAPVDEETGEKTDWILGPERVIEVGKGNTFGRVQGITSITPQQEHIQYLEDQIFRTVGLSDVALGTADAPEAGIALAMKLQPIADVADEKNLVINGVLTQMLHDLATEWFSVYEGQDMSMADFTSTTQNDLLPFDRDGRFLELAAMYTNGWVTIEWVLGELREKFGYEFDADMAAQALAAADTKAKQAAAVVDPYASRAGSELDAADQDEEDADA